MFLMGLINHWLEFHRHLHFLCNFGGGEAGRNTLSRMNNDAKLRGGGSKHTGLLFLLDISPWGCRHSNPFY